MELLDRHGRRVLRKHVRMQKACVPAARMVYDFCRLIEVPCVVRSVVCVIRNARAVELDIHPLLPRKAEIPVNSGAACIILGDVPDVPEPENDDLINLHVVPVVGGEFIDLTLDAHTDHPGLGFRPLPPIWGPHPKQGAMIIAPLDGYNADISYGEAARQDTFQDLPAWHFNMMPAAQELWSEQWTVTT